jgi:hypothetical protein
MISCGDATDICFFKSPITGQIPDSFTYKKSDLILEDKKTILRIRDVHLRTEIFLIPVIIVANFPFFIFFCTPEGEINSKLMNQN